MADPVTPASLEVFGPRKQPISLAGFYHVHRHGDGLPHAYFDTREDAARYAAYPVLVAALKGFLNPAQPFYQSVETAIAALQLADGSIDPPGEREMSWG